MTWLELSVTVRADQQERVELALEDLGSLAVTLLDAEDNPIFEPAPGETPVWPTLQLQALFDADTDRPGLLAALLDLVPEFGPENVQFRDVADQEWTRAWMDTYQPMQFGRRLWIYPWNIEPPADLGDDAIVVRLDPGLAFGTGTHPTTALCLEWLDGSDLAGKTVVDFGCGSGVLAIAALKLGAARAIGVDNDAQALTASRDNAQRNGVSQVIDLYTPDELPSCHAELMVANILAGPLHDLAPQFAARLQVHGALAISGILAGQEAELLVRYGEWFEHLQVATRGDWVRITGVRRKI